MATTSVQHSRNKIKQPSWPSHPILFALFLNVLLFRGTNASAVPRVGGESHDLLRHFRLPARFFVSRNNDLSPIRTNFSARAFERSSTAEHGSRSLQPIRKDSESYSDSLKFSRASSPTDRTKSTNEEYKEKMRKSPVRHILSEEQVKAGEEEHVGEENVVTDVSDEEDDDEDGDGDGDGDEVEEEEGGDNDDEKKVEEEHINTTEQFSTKNTHTSLSEQSFPTEKSSLPEKESFSLEPSTAAETSDSGQSEESRKDRPLAGNVEELSKTIRAAADEKSEDNIQPQENSEENTSSLEDSEETVSKDRGKKKQSEDTSASRSVFRGIPGGDIGGTNITHLSYMLYKIIKTYDIKTVLDIPCRNNLNWFPKLLPLLDFEVVGFKYICVDEGADSDEDLHRRFSDAGSPEFLSVPPHASYTLPKSELVFSFDGPQQWGVRKTWGFFTGLRKSRPKYVIVTNNPGQMNDDREGTLNLRKQPFHFSQAMRVISNVETSGKPKQLVFYETEHIREGF